MDRRTFLARTGAALLAAPLVAEAQQGEKVRQMGVLATFSSEHPQRDLFHAFRRGLRELGDVEGQNIVIEYRSARARRSDSRISSQS